MVRHLVAEVKHLRAELVVLTDEVASLRRAPDSQGSERLLRLEEVAERWQVCPRTVETEVSDGHLEPTYVRGARRFRLATVEAYEKSSTGRRRSAARRRK